MSWVGLSSVVVLGLAREAMVLYNAGFEDEAISLGGLFASAMFWQDSNTSRIRDWRGIYGAICLNCKEKKTGQSVLENGQGVEQG